MSTVPDPTDLDLLIAVADGDGRALRELYERHSTWLAVRLRHRCADPGVVRDVLQETFVAVWRGAHRYRGDGEVAAWIWGIGIRRLIAQLRSPSYSAELSLPAAGDATDVAAEDRVLRSIEYGELGPAMDALSPEFRAVIQATVLDGLTTREAARLLGIPHGTVKTRAMRARQQLRLHLAGGLA